MELKQYLQIVRRWAWLLVLGVVLGGVAGLLGTNYEEPVYQASTRQPDLKPGPQPPPVPAPAYSFLNRVASLPRSPEELPPPDPPKR